MGRKALFSLRSPSSESTTYEESRSFKDNDRSYKHKIVIIIKIILMIKITIAI